MDKGRCHTCCTKYGTLPIAILAGGSCPQPSQLLPSPAPPRRLWPRGVWRCSFSRTQDCAPLTVNSILSALSSTTKGAPDFGARTTPAASFLALLANSQHHFPPQPTTLNNRPLCGHHTTASYCCCYTISPVILTPKKTKTKFTHFANCEQRRRASAPLHHFDTNLKHSSHHPQFNVHKATQHVRSI